MINICEWINKLTIAMIDLWYGEEEECKCKCCTKKAE